MDVISNKKIKIKNKNILKCDIKAFSIMEIMIALVALSFLLAAFAPVLSKRLEVNRNSAASYLRTDPNVCKKYLPEVNNQENKHCNLCNIKDKVCLNCDIDVEKCSGDPDLETCTCCPLGTIKIPAGGDTGIEKYDGKNFICVTKYNIGDKVNGEGFDIPATAGVNISSPEVLCGNMENYTAKCCWKGNNTYHTAIAASSFSLGDYGVLDRTVCTWSAASAICTSLNGSLIATDTLRVLARNYSINIEDEYSDLQFCSETTSGTHAYSHCHIMCNAQGCRGSYQENDTKLGCCRPYQLWAKENVDNRYAGSIWIRNNTGDTVTIHNINSSKSHANSVRCMIKAIQPQ